MLPQLHGLQKEEHTDRRTATQHRKQVIELGKGHPRQISKAIAWEATMLSEKFFLVLETLLRSNDTQPDGSTRVVSSSPHVPVKLPEKTNKS